MPVFNGVRFLEDRLNSILNQTFSDFELIISDNASTDRTQAICEEFCHKDKRIRYIRQEKNLGFTRNMKVVLDEAKNNYFVLAAVDDQWKPDFLEKCVDVLLSKKNVVGCNGLVSAYIIPEEAKSEKVDFYFQSFLRKVRFSSKSSKVISLSGSYEKKVCDFLNKGYPDMFYGLFRTDKIRKSLPDINFGLGFAYAIILRVLQYGDFYALNDVLMLKYDGGLSKKGVFGLAKTFNQGFLGTLFPDYPFTRWCIKQLGTKLFLKNLPFFIQLNLWGEFTVIIDSIRILTRSIRNNHN